MTTNIIAWSTFTPMISLAPFVSDELLVTGLFLLILAICLLPDSKKKRPRRDV